jgi:P pilus assembly chaperone PapD
MIKLLIPSLLFMLAISTSDALALKLKPMKQDFSYKGKNRSKTFKLKNDESYKMSFKVKVLTRSFSKNNIEQQAPTQDFKVSHRRFELLPGKSKHITLKYIGSNSLIEKSYTLAIDEVATADGVEQRSYLSQIEASLYIGSKNQRASLAVKKAIQINNNLELSFENRGTKHIKLSRYKVVLGQGKIKTSISFRDKKYLKLGEQIILPGAPRTITIENLSKFNPGKVDAKFHRLYRK